MFARQISSFYRLFRAVGRDRTTTALLLAGVVIGIIFLARTPKAGVLLPQEYWAMKTSWQGCADIVLAGDSRLYRGVSPQAMKDFLPGKTILNFGFSANGYSQEYLDRTAEVLRPGGQRAIVLGITPRSLTPAAIQTNGFIKAMQDAAARLGPQAADTFWAQFDGLCEPVAFDQAFTSLLPWKPRSRYTSDYQADGWVRSEKTPENPRYMLTSYATTFDGNQVDPEVVNRLLARVRQWRQAGIAVYGFRVPTTAEMVALENRFSGFDEKAFMSAFAQEGGTWIAVDQAKYHSYDGSHLRYDGAMQLSHDLARQIALGSERYANWGSLNNPGRYALPITGRPQQ